MKLSEMKELKEKYGYDDSMISKLTGISIQTLQEIFDGNVQSKEINTLLSLTGFFRELQMNLGYVAETSAYHTEKKQGEYTIEDYYNLSDNRRIELIDGVIYDMASPTEYHQDIVGEIFRQIANYIVKNSGRCKAIIAPYDVQLDKDDKTMVQPDLLIKCKKEDNQKHDRIPEFVMEVMSPSTKQKDLHVKQKKYRNAGVREYWIVDPENRTVAVYEFEKSSFAINYEFKESIPVGIYDGKLKINLSLLIDR